MIANQFEYMRASSVDDAITLMVKHGDDAKLLAGGHSLLPAMKLRLNQPGVLIDIGRIPELKYIREDSGQLAIGAGTTHHELATSELARKTISMLSEAADLIGDVQVRNMGTLGGSLAHADPAADWPAVLIAANASIEVRGPNGKRSVSAEDFFTGFYMTALEENELITAIRMPIPPQGTRSSYQKFMQPASRFAIVGCAAMIRMQGNTCEDARIGFTGVADTAFRAASIEQALKGQKIHPESLDRAVKDVAEGMMVLSDHFASEEYRLHLARVFAKRAILAATK